MRPGRGSSVQCTEIHFAPAHWHDRPVAAGGGAPDPDRAGLSARETEVLSAIGQRLTNREIADRMVISIRTVESHVSALLRKLAVTDRAGLVAAAGELARQGQRRPLPEPATRFVARDAELAEIAALLDESRLVTVVGPAGVGKTRLAVRLAAVLAPRYAEGARLADFAELPAGSAVAGTVARTLNLVDQPSRSTAETLRDTALHMDCLLVADNCEHVLDELAPLLDSVLMAAGPGSSDTGSGGLRMLATSRQPIAVPGEVVYELAPLATAEATALFVDRAAAAGGIARRGRTRRPSRSCAGRWTGCRWPSSWPRPGPGRSGPISCSSSCRAGSSCSSAARGPPGRRTAACGTRCS